jgi:ketosteroid isomerase-like protein
MPAQKPEECDILLMETMNRGDLEAAVALYEPSAVLVQDPSGEVINGHAAIREFIRAGLALGLRMTRQTTVIQNGDLALTGGRWKATGTDADGRPVALSGNSREVVRRQPDGTWLFAIDSPWGAGLE